MEAYCRICTETQEVAVAGNLDRRQILVPLKCGHTFNWVNGDCYTKEQLKDRAGILCDTINRLTEKIKERQKRAIDAIQDII